MNFDYILLDLDGTLTNPIEGITKSINYAMKKMGKPLVPDELISRHIGPPLRAGYIQNLGFTEEEAERAVELYRERYMPTGLYENELIEGAAELLERLSGAGKVIAMATSKPEEMAVRLMEHFDLIKYFDFISGAAMDAGGRHEKTDIILHALENLGIDTPEKLSKTVMVGDRFHDIKGAENTGVKSLAVLSGFGSREEFEEYGADFIAENLIQACNIILNA
ncbi:MAG: HAD-IA family hydrolase [Oscillospiraceae bacterium]|jgi:phosphoglycolate phosphatase|nr:HAD-IA family hydrolase [Oscillospiraceae bacterium]